MSSRGPILTVTLTTDNKRFTSGLSSATRDLQRFSTDVGRKVGGIDFSGLASRFGGQLLSDLDALGTKIISTVAGWFKAGALIGGAAIAGVLGVGLTRGLGRVLDVEDAQVQLGRLGLGITDIDDLLKMVDRTFDGTVFANPDGFAAVSQFFSSGMSTKEIERNLGNLADMAAFANVPLDQMLSIFTLIQNQGRVTARELNRLSDAGIPLAYIAESLGVGVDELRTMASKGDLTSEMFFGAIDGIEQFEGAAKSAGDTTRGAWSNVWTAIAAVGESFLRPFFGEGGMVVSGLQNIREIVRSFRPLAERAGQALSNWVNDPATAAMFARAWERVLAVFRELQGIFTTVYDGYKEYRQEIMKIVDAIGPAAGIVATLAVAVSALKWAFLLLIKATPVGILLALATGLVYAWQNSEKFREIVTNAFERVKKTAEDVFAAVSAWFDRNRDTIVEWKDKAVEAFGAFVGWIQEHLVPVVEAQLEFIIAAVERFVEGAKLYWDNFGEETVAIIVNAFRTIKGIIEGVLKIITGIFQIFTAILTGDWSKLWEGVKNIVRGAAGVVLAIIRGWIGQIRTVWDSVWSWVTSTVSEAWQGVTRAVSSGTLSVVNYVAGLPGRILNALGNVGSILFNAGRAILNGLWDGMKSKWNEMTGWIGGLAGRITNLKGPPEYDKTILTDNGRLIMGGLLDGMKAGWGDVESYLTGVTGQLSGGIAPRPAMGAGGPVNVTINAGLGVDGIQLGRQIDQVLQKYYRAGGR